MGWQDGVDEGLGCIWAEVFLVKSYSVPSIYHLPGRFPQIWTEQKNVG